MRKLLLCTPMILMLILLSACGNKAASGDALALKFRTDYLAMQSCAGVAEIHSDYGERVYEYTLAFSCQTGGDTQLTITQPEDLAGITAQIAQGETFLEFEGASLETGPLTPGGLSPIDAIPATLAYMRDGYIAECGMEQLGEQNCLRLQFREPGQAAGEGTEAVLWLDEESGKLVRAEMKQAGFMVLSCQFTAFEKG